MPFTYKPIFGTEKILKNFKKGLDKSRDIGYNITTVEDTPERGERLVRYRRSLGSG